MSLSRGGDGSNAAGNGGIYNASVVHDSAEDVRQVLEKQDEESGQIENVRACCDGEFSNPRTSLNSRY
jgi:hypothetical protein